MTHQEILFSPTDNFSLFRMSVWTWISLEKESSWRLNLKTSSIQCNNNPVLVTPCKKPGPMKDVYDGQTYDLKTRVGIWTRMDLVPVRYKIFSQKFYLEMWFFQFITGITFNCDYANVSYYCSTGVDWSLKQIEDL